MSLASRLAASKQALLPEDIATLDLVVERGNFGEGVRLFEIAKRFGKSIEESVTIMSRLQAGGLVDYNLSTGYTITNAGFGTVQEMDEYGDFVVKSGGKAQTHNVLKHLSQKEIEAHGGHEKAVQTLTKHAEPHVAKGTPHHEVEKHLRAKADEMRKSACKPGEKMVFGTCRKVGMAHEEKLQETGTFSASVGGRAPAQIHGATTAATGPMTPERAKKLKRLAAERERTRDRLRELAQESRSLRRRPLLTIRD